MHGLQYVFGEQLCINIYFFDIKVGVLQKEAFGNILK